MIYCNGDSHSAGAEIIENITFAQDDPRYLVYGRRAHPEVINKTFTATMASRLNMGFFLDAESGCSNDRILRTTKEFLANSKQKPGMVIIGWSTFEREEFWHEGDYVQYTASGTDSVPEEMQGHYKEWISSQTETRLDEKVAEWHKKIWDFHCELKEADQKHIFFNTYLEFDEIAVPKSERKDWGNYFIGPYNKEQTYFYYLQKQGFQTVNPNSYHYGSDAHDAWRKVLMQNWFDHYPQFRLTEPKNKVIINKAKFRDFSGFNR